MTKDLKFHQAGQKQSQTYGRVECGHPGCPKTFSVGWMV